jgi:hypothetical protein
VQTHLKKGPCYGIFLSSRYLDIGQLAESYELRISWIAILFFFKMLPWSIVYCWCLYCLQVDEGNCGDISIAAQPFQIQFSAFWFRHAAELTFSLEQEAIEPSAFLYWCVHEWIQKQWSSTMLDIYIYIFLSCSVNLYCSLLCTFVL